MWDCDDVVSSTKSKKQVSEPVKPVLQLQSVATTGGWSLSPAGLLSLESELEEIQVRISLLLNYYKVSSTIISSSHQISIGTSSSL